MDLALITFLVVALGFSLLVLLAIRRMFRKKSEDTPDGELERADESDELQTLEPSDSESEDSGEYDSDEDEEDIVAAESVEKERDSREAGSRANRPDVSSKKSVSAQKGALSDQDLAEEKQRISRGLAKTRGGFITRLGNLFRGKADLDPALLDQVEEVLFTADIGVGTSHELIEGLRSALSKKEITNPAAIWEFIKKRSNEILGGQDLAPPLDLQAHKPFVILMVGVNGTGKTTTIGKLAARFKGDGMSVVLAAGDTFRAAAVEQLEVWGQRSECAVVKGKANADPSSVIVDALKIAQENQADLLIADTAGRLHTKIDLMEEIKKVRRAVGKRLPGAPHETWLVLDSTTGQNAIAQAKMFKEAVDITGIVLTKLDGTAKGGVVLGICNELKLPVRYIGIGEGIEDLRTFSAKAFVEALYESSGNLNETA